ncbi:MAG: hypothetical protein ACRCWR_00080, partial [Saezia sp.]
FAPDNLIENTYGRLGSIRAFYDAIPESVRGGVANGIGAMASSGGPMENMKMGANTFFSATSGLSEEDKAKSVGPILEALKPFTYNFDTFKQILSQSSTPAQFNQQLGDHQDMLSKRAVAFEKLKAITEAKAAMTFGQRLQQNSVNSPTPSIKRDIGGQLARYKDQLQTEDGYNQVVERLSNVDFSQVGDTEETHALNEIFAAEDANYKKSWWSRGKLPSQKAAEDKNYLRSVVKDYIRKQAGVSDPAAPEPIEDSNIMMR